MQSNDTARNILNRTKRAIISNKIGGQLIFVESDDGRDFEVGIRISKSETATIEIEALCPKYCDIQIGISPNSQDTQRTWQTKFHSEIHKVHLDSRHTEVELQDKRTATYIALLVLDIAKCFMGDKELFELLSN